MRAHRGAEGRRRTHLDVHELELEVRDLVALRALEGEAEDVRALLSLRCVSEAEGGRRKGITFSTSESSLPAQRRILDMEPRLRPSESGRWHWNLSKPSERSRSEIRDTWELSIAWRAMPEEEQSKLVSVTRSFIASSTFFSRLACESLASNIAAHERQSLLAARIPRQSPHAGRAERGGHAAEWRGDAPRRQAVASCQVAVTSCFYAFARIRNFALFELSSRPLPPWAAACWAADARGPESSEQMSALAWEASQSRLIGFAISVRPRDLHTAR